jgi:hypothetical protein
MRQDGSGGKYEAGIATHIGFGWRNESGKVDELTLGTSLERIGDESLTRMDSGFVHRDM